MLVDRSRTRRRDGQFSVLRTAGGMVVKHAVNGADSGWRTQSPTLSANDCNDRCTLSRGFVTSNGRQISGRLSKKL